MAKVTGYHRPESVGDALALLADTSGTRRVLLAGGTVVNADQGRDPIEVVDLQAAGLAGIDVDGRSLTVGAMTTLQVFADSESVPELLADLARRELPSSLRTIATIGGLVAQADSESELLAGLLAYGAAVEGEDQEGAAVLELAEVLGDRDGAAIITRVRLDTVGSAAGARAARTPGDVPIVAAVAHKAGDGSVRIAMCGVAATPVIVDDVATLDPPGDFRGSSAYRRHLAGVLGARAAAELG